MNNTNPTIAAVDTPQASRPNIKLLLAGLVLLLSGTAALATAISADSSDGSLDDNSGIINDTTLQVLAIAPDRG